MSQHPPLRDLPSVTALLNTAELKEAVARYGHSAVADAARSAIDRLRIDLQEGRRADQIPSGDSIAASVVAGLNVRHATGLRPVINATGVLLHTNLGRAPLAPQAAQAAALAGAGYCNVELNLDSGKRSKRSQAVADALRRLTGAEAAHVVNNNAGALGLVLGGLAAGREIIASHGELIEIGGGYRLPEVIEIFGGRLRAVGATNKTRASDYANAIGPETGALLAVHPSNYQVRGFTEAPRIEELAALARQHNVPLVHDIGSGALIDLAEFGFPDEPVASRSVDAGADVVLFSGDKLLGGPQCGIIVGRADLLDAIMRHPLNRALRVDKMTLAALRVTLELYEHGEQARDSVPLMQLLSAKPATLETRARALAERLSSGLGDWQVEVMEDQAYLGGGTTPDQALASWSVALSSTSRSVGDLARQLRLGDPAVVPRVQRERLIIALHSLLPADDDRLAAAVADAARRLTGGPQAAQT